MSPRRTDLAMEARQLWQEGAGEGVTLRGVVSWREERQGFPVERVEILDEEGAQALGKERGRYMTLLLEESALRGEGGLLRAARAVAETLGELLPEGPVLVAGLGNRAITPDAVGPLTREHILVTRHLTALLPEHFGTWRQVSSLAAEVQGNTGMESGDLVAAVCEKLSPACVIAVDALAARSLDRLCRTVQVTDTGIVPGSGVGNRCRGLNRETLGVPVVAVGVPTVVDGNTLAADLLGAEDCPQGESFFVTPKDIDRQVEDFAKVLGYGIDLALHPGLTLEELEVLVG